MDHIYASVKTFEKYSYTPCTSYFLALRSFRMFTGPLFQIKLHLLNIVLLSGFLSFEILWVKQYLVDVTGLGAYQTQLFTRPILFAHGSGMENCPKFYHWYMFAPI